MWLLLSLALHTAAPVPPTAYAVLAAEHARGGDARALGVLKAAAASRDSLLQRLAARAYGRIQRAEFAGEVTPLLRAPAIAVRREAANAMAQMNAPFDFAALLASEREPSVRGAIFESIGRSTAPLPTATVVSALTGGLLEAAGPARTGAARGMESLLRRTARSAKPSAETVGAIRAALRATSDMETRQLLLLALTAAGDRDSATLAVALRDTSAQVRRLAVALSRTWLDDPSSLVRYQALRVAGSCERATVALHDVNEHVVLTAVDLLGEQSCAATRLDSLVVSGSTWRIQAHALVALAKVDSARARAQLARAAASPVWQARAWTAQAAKALHDTPTLARLARDSAPNVAIAAMTTDDDALRALRGTHAGLVLAAATHFKGAPTLGTHSAQLADALLRLSAARIATNRDPRMALLQRLVESADSATAVRLAPLTADNDPSVAALAAQVVSTRAHIATAPTTVRYVPAPFPSAATLASLRGATAELRLKSLGTIVLYLLPDDAPVTVATFVALAERGAFNGLTWHRIVPNFVVQGGSPGADEYDGITPTFLRDEVGFARHARGTFGISTRGRDTGDGQLFINLVDNFRLDHDYTVFATMLKGFDVMDRVQEGDVIESIRIFRSH